MGNGDCFRVACFGTIRLFHILIKACSYHKAMKNSSTETVRCVPVLLLSHKGLPAI